MRIALLLMACLASLSSATLALEIDRTGAVIAGFETQEELGKWQARALTTLELTSAWAAKGKHAAAITYHKWEPGKEQWPAILGNASAGALPVTDFSGFDAISFTAFNPQKEPAVVKLHISDGSARYAQTFTLKPGGPQECTVSISEIASSVDESNIATVHFYVTEPATTYTVYVDDLRLDLDAVGPAQALATQIRATRAEALRLTRGAETSLQTDRALTRISTLLSQAEGVISAVRSGEVNDLEALRAQSERVRRVAAEYEDAKSVLPQLKAIQYARKVGADQFVLGTETSMQKVFLEAGRFNSAFGDSYSLAAARNEHESFQAIVFPLENSLRNVKWAVTDLTSKAGGTLPASVRLVGYVETKQPSYPVDFNGWWPDPLLDFKTEVQAVPPGEVLPLWVTVDVPEDAAPGVYDGVLTVTAASAKLQSIAIRFTVWDFVLPKSTHLRTALSWRGHLSQLYPEDQVAAMESKYHDWMLEEYYLNPNNIYAGPPTQWDAERLKDLRRKGLNAINLGYFSAPREPDFNAASYWRSYEAKVEQIKKYMPVIEEAGCRDICFIYCFDERPANQLDVVFETSEKLKKIWPDIPVMTTAYDRTFGLERDNGHTMDIWVPLTPHFDGNRDYIAEAREKGRDIWWYICIGPKHPFANWFVEWPAIEARLLMGTMTAKYEPGGFLYYAVNRWPVNNKVITDGPKTDWDPASYQINNGDGSIMCAGPNGPLATIRLENIRDGIEDYEYYMLLRGLLAAKKRSPKLGEVPESVVEDLAHYTYDPQVLYKERARVAKLIVALGK